MVLYSRLVDDKKLLFIVQTYGIYRGTQVPLKFTAKGDHQWLPNIYRFSRATRFAFPDRFLGNVCYVMKRLKSSLESPLKLQIESAFSTIIIIIIVI